MIAVTTTSDRFVGFASNPSVLRSAMREGVVLIN